MTKNSISARLVWASEAPKANSATNRKLAAVTEIAVDTSSSIISTLLKMGLRIAAIRGRSSNFSTDFDSPLSGGSGTKMQASAATIGRAMIRIHPITATCPNRFA